MLNDAQIQNLKPKDKIYQFADSNGLIIEITPTGDIGTVLQKNHKSYR
ncbi:hypothetical protein [Candidatus Thiodubiliella endoseptemdiera]